MPDARKDPVFGRAGGDSKQIQSHLNDSEETLLDELADLLFQTTDENLDTERLNALLDRLDEAAPLPQPVSAEESLERFHQKFADKFAAIEAESAGTSVSSPEKKRSKHGPLKIFIIAAVLIILLGTVTVQAGGWNPLAALARWTSEIFQIGGSSVDYAAVRTRPLEVGESASYDTLREAVDAFGIDAPIIPQWIPERFTLDEVVASNRSGSVLIYADYSSDDGTFQIRYKETPKLDLSSIEIESSDEETHWKKGIKHYILTDLGYEKAFWQNGELECQMFGDVSEQELKDIINSIYLEE